MGMLDRMDRSSKTVLSERRPAQPQECRPSEPLGFQNKCTDRNVCDGEMAFSDEKT